jgi:type VI secretion system protein ImpI
MELVFEMLNTKQFVPTELCQKTFKQAGGVIGRGEDCDWIIPDRKRHLSNHHAIVSYREGAFSSPTPAATVFRTAAAALACARANRCASSTAAPTCWATSRFVHGWCVTRRPSTVEVGRPRAAGSIIPDDAFLDLDPLNAIEQQERVYSEIDELLAPTPSPRTRQRADYARIDMESLMVPELVAPVEPEPAGPESRRASERGFLGALRCGAGRGSQRP